MLLCPATHSDLNLSPGLDFETKRNIAEVPRTELGRKSNQPIECELRLTRSVIEVLKATRHPFGLVTKSSAVEQDLDLIAPTASW